MCEEQGRTPIPGPPHVSVVVPVIERPVSLADLFVEFSEPLRELGWDFEFIFVLDGRHADQGATLDALVASGEPVQVIRMGHSVGETVLLRAGSARAGAPVLVTLPAYPRIVPSALPAVVRPVLGAAAVSVARRWPRRDSWLNRMQNAAFHFLLRPVSEGAVHDVACGVQVFRKEVFDALPLYGEFHRFLPILAFREGHSVQEVEAPQHPKDQSPRVFSPGTYLKRVLDILGLFFLVHFTERPLRFFGLAGALSALTGGAILALLFVERLQGQSLADRPLLLLGAIAFVLGVQAIALGLVGELIVFVNAPNRRGYRVLTRDHGWEEVPATREEVPALKDRRRSQTSAVQTHRQPERAG